MRGPSDTSFGTVDDDVGETLFRGFFVLTNRPIASLRVVLPSNLRRKYGDDDDDDSTEISLGARGVSCGFIRLITA